MVYVEPGQMGWRPLRDSWMQAELPPALTQAQRDHVGLCPNSTLLSSPLQAYNVLLYTDCIVHCSKHHEFGKRQSIAPGFDFFDTNAQVFFLLT